MLRYFRCLFLNRVCDVVFWKADAKKIKVVNLLPFKFVGTFEFYWYAFSAFWCWNYFFFCFNYVSIMSWENCPYANFWLINVRLAVCYNINSSNVINFCASNFNSFKVLVNINSSVVLSTLTFLVVFKFNSTITLLGKATSDVKIFCLCF